MNVEELQAAWVAATEAGDRREARTISDRLIGYGRVQLEGAQLQAARAQDRPALLTMVANLTRYTIALAHWYRAAAPQLEAEFLQLRTVAPPSDVRSLLATVKREAKKLRQVRPVVQHAQGMGPEDRVLALLEENEQGKILPSLGNLVKILEHDSRQEGRWQLNEMSLRLEVDGRIYQRVDASEAAIWVAECYGLHIATRAVEEAILVVATRNPRHPVREYLDGLEWDGVQRLDHLLTDYFDAAGGSPSLLAAYGRCWMMSAVARVFEPGCKADCVLILQGEQGARKSQALQVLAGDGNWADSHIDTRSKDGYQILIGVWLFEIAEFDKFSGTRDPAWLKSFFSSRHDLFRRPYAVQPEPAYRQVVFMGTTNTSGFLSDPTGNRRYWCVEVGRVDLEGLAEVRDQLWAEAVTRYRNGEQWWLTDELEDERRAEEGQWLEGNAWVELLERLLALKSWPDVRAHELLGPDYLDVPKERWPKMSRALAGALRQLRYRKVRKGQKGNRIYVWTRR